MYLIFHSYFNLFEVLPRLPVHWWSSEIAELRKVSGSACRRYQRCGRRENMESREQEREAYVVARCQLRSAIRKSQEEVWGMLCTALDNDPWGLLYRVVYQEAWLEDDFAAGARSERSFIPVPTAT